MNKIYPIGQDEEYYPPTIFNSWFNKFITKGLLWAFIIWMACVFLVPAVLPIKFIQTTKDGTHTGYVTAVETNGIIWKTDRVYFKTDTESTQEEAYCVTDKQLKEKLIFAEKNKQRVTLHFNDYWIVGWSLCKGEPVLIGVEE